MKVSVRLIGSYRKLLPPNTEGSHVEIDVPSGTSVAGLLSQFEVPLTGDSVILVNGLSISWESALAEGDEVSAFSAMAGG